MSQTPVAPEDIAARFRMAGVVPPNDRAAGTYANAQRMLAALHWLRQPRSMADEPAHIFTHVPRD